MSGLILLIAGIALIIYAIQHDKKSTTDKWLKDWGFWIISVLILLMGIFSLGDSSPGSIFGAVMLLALLGLIYWRVTDRSKKDLHGKKRVIHGFITALCVFIWFCIFGSIYNEFNAHEPISVPKTTTSADNNKDSYIKLDGNKIYFIKAKKYIIDENDSSWSGAEAKVSNVTIYKTEDGYSYGTKRGRKSIQGILALKVKVKALKDIQVLMNSATISIPSINEQHDVETKDDWDEIDKGISKTGTVYIPIYKLSNIKNIKSLRFKFDCQLQDSDDIDDMDHTYDMTINLN